MAWENGGNLKRKLIAKEARVEVPKTYYQENNGGVRWVYIGVDGVVV